MQDKYKSNNKTCMIIIEYIQNSNIYIYTYTILPKVLSSPSNEQVWLL